MDFLEPVHVDNLQNSTQNIQRFETSFQVFRDKQEMKEASHHDHNEIRRRRRESEMRDDLVEEVDGEIDLLVRENEIDVILQ